MIVVRHELDMGLCGHSLKFADVERVFTFEHPQSYEDEVEWAAHLVADEFGPQFVDNIDWERSVVLRDDS